MNPILGARMATSPLSFLAQARLMAETLKVTTKVHVRNGSRAHGLVLDMLVEYALLYKYSLGVTSLNPLASFDGLLN